MEYHMLYVESIKSLEDKKDKKKYFFAECEKTLGKLASLPTVKKHSAKNLFAECQKKHSAKSLFVECF